MVVPDVQSVRAKLSQRWPAIVTVLEINTAHFYTHSCISHHVRIDNELPYTAVP